MSTHLSIRNCLADFPKVYVSLFMGFETENIHPFLSLKLLAETETTFRAVLMHFDQAQRTAFFYFGSAFSGLHRPNLQMQHVTLAPLKGHLFLWG